MCAAPEGNTRGLLSRGELVDVTWRLVRKLQSEEVVAMSEDHLFALVTQDPEVLRRGPRGTNCGWVLRENLRQAIAGDPGLRAFTEVRS